MEIKNRFEPTQRRLSSLLYGRFLIRQGLEFTVCRFGNRRYNRLEPAPTQNKTAAARVRAAAEFVSKRR